MTHQGKKILLSIWGSIDTIHRPTTNDPFRATWRRRIISRARIIATTKNWNGLTFGLLTVRVTKPGAISSQQRARCNHQDYRPRRLRQVLWYSSITRQHFILQFSSILHLQCQLPETEVSRRCHIRSGLTFNLAPINFMDIIYSFKCSRDWNHPLHIFRFIDANAYWKMSAQNLESAWNGVQFYCVSIRWSPKLILWNISWTHGFDNKFKTWYTSKKGLQMKMSNLRGLVLFLSIVINIMRINASNKL